MIGYYSIVPGSFVTLCRGCPNVILVMTWPMGLCCVVLQWFYIGYNAIVPGSFVTYCRGCLNVILVMTWPMGLCCVVPDSLCSHVVAVQGHTMVMTWPCMTRFSSSSVVLYRI